jgi:hypothetical protein
VETPCFVKATGAEVGLKAPELQRFNPASLRNLDQLRPCAPPDVIGAGIKQPDFLTLARQKGDDAARVFGDDDLAVLEDDIGDEGAVFGRRVEHRQESQQPVRR